MWDAMLLALQSSGAPLEATLLPPLVSAWSRMYVADATEEVAANPLCGKLLRWLREKGILTPASADSILRQRMESAHGHRTTYSWARYESLWRWVSKALALDPLAVAPIEDQRERVNRAYVDEIQPTEARDEDDDPPPLVMQEYVADAWERYMRQ